MDTLDSLRAEIRRDVAEIRSAIPVNNNTAGIHIHGGGLVAIIVGIVGTFAILVAVCAVLIVSAWRSADMQYLSQLRGDMREQQQYRQQFSDRLNSLEATNADPEKR